MKTDKELLKQLSKDSTSALEVLIKRYTPYVAAVISNQLGRFSTKSDVEELSSDVFFALWQWRGRLGDDNLRGWLGVTARNQARSFLRKQKLDTTEAEDWLLVDDDQAVRLLEERELVQQALDALEPENREIFLRYYFYSQTVIEIAGTMDLGVSAVKSRLSRGRKKLKEVLRMGGYTIED